MIEMRKQIDIVFDKLPGHEGAMFIEVEDEKGASIRFGEWVTRPDGFVALRFHSLTDEAQAIIDRLEKENAELRARLPKPGSLVLEPITMDNLPKVGEWFVLREHGALEYKECQWQGNDKQLDAAYEGRAWRLPQEKSEIDEGE